MKEPQGFVPGRHLSIKFTKEDEDLMNRIMELKALASFLSMSALLKILLRAGIGQTTQFFREMDSGGVGSTLLDTEPAPQDTRPPIPPLPPKPPRFQEAKQSKFSQLRF